MPRKKVIKKEEPVREESVQAVSESEQVEQPTAPVPEVKLPDGVLRIEEVEVNGRKFNKFWKSDGTTYLELL